MCFVRTVTQRNRYAARTAKKSGSKAAHGSDKTEQGGTLPPPACQIAAERPVSARAHGHPRGKKRSRRTPSVPKDDACDARELWCFAGCLSPILPPTAQATRRGRRVCALNVPTRLLRRPRFLGARVLGSGSRHIRAAVVAARSSYPRATLCADALVYRLQLQTPCVAKSSSAGDSSLANKGSPRATPRADPL